MSDFFLVDFALGGVSAMISKSLTAPIDRIKLLLQNQEILIKENKNFYKGINDCLIKITNKQGISSLWRGNLTNCLRYFPSQALNFAFNEKYKTLFIKKYNKNKKSDKKNSLKIEKNSLNFPLKNQIFLSILAGGTAGLTSTAITYPLDFARTRLATDINQEFRGIKDVFFKIKKKNGILGLYKGIGISSLGIIQYRGIYFGFYDSFKDLSNGNFLIKFFFAKLGTSISSFLSYPFDTIRRRLMLQSGREKVEYLNGFDCFLRIFKEEGIKGFYKGGLSNFFRGIGGSLVLVLYDEMQEGIRRGRRVEGGTFGEF